MKSTKKSLIASALSLVLCISMLLGTTYAWFTDSVTSGKNKIIAGNLDVELTHTNANVTNQKVQDATDLFGVALWEPGVIAWENLTVTNVGNLALKYALNLNVFDKNATTAGNDLTEVIKVAVIDGGFTATGDPVADRASAQAITTYESLKDFQKTGNLAGGDSTGDTFGVVLYWQPTDNDNLYNLKNGLASTDGQPLFVEFGVNLVATQDTVESDAFDKYYDKNATFPNIPTIGTKASATVEVPADKSNGMTIKNDLATLEIPAENIDGDASKYRLDVERIENIEGEGAVTLTSDTNTLVTFDVSLVKITASTETPVSGEALEEYNVTLYVGTHCELVKLYHKGTEITNFNYNPANGEVTYKTKSFSPYAGEIKFAGGEGTEKYPYLLETVEQFKAIGEFCTREAQASPWYYDYKYYKVLDGVEKWDFLGQEAFVNMCGSFDGNGVKMVNVNSELFAYVLGEQGAGKGSAYIRNFDITFGDGNYGGVVYCNNTENITMENVKVHGYLESEGNSGSFFDYAGLTQKVNITLKNCSSDLTIVATAGTNGAYIGHTYCASGSKLVLDNVTFTGQMYGGAARISGYGNDISIGKIEVTENGVNTKDNKMDSERVHTLQKEKGNLPEKYNAFTTTKAAGFDHAIATLSVGPNGNGKERTGSYYIAQYLEEVETLVMTDTDITTSVIKYFDITSNGDATQKTGISDDGKTFNVVDSFNGTHVDGAHVKIVQYDADGNILKITTWDVTPK